MFNYKRLHWFPFCPPDWTTKIIANGLSVPAEGVLIALLCIQWLESSIPSDIPSIIKCLRGYNDLPTIQETLKLFVTHPSNPSRLYYPPLESARQEAILTSNRRKKAGELGAAATNAKFHKTTPRILTPERN